MANYHIYLAGRLSGPKWQIPAIIERLEADIYALYPPKYPNRFTFTSSDADEHKMWGDGGYGMNKDRVEELVTLQIAQADWLVAYVDDRKCYGTIAELAYASAIGKPSLLFIGNKKDNQKGGIRLQSKQPQLLVDAYRLVSNFPLVTTFEVDSLFGAAFGIWSFIQCESPIELQLLNELIRENVCVIPQLWIGDYRVDFAVVPSKLVIEVDGHDFHSSKDQRGKDAKRDRFLQSKGWRVIRFTGSEIYANPSAAASEVLSMIATCASLEKDTR